MHGYEAAAVDSLKPLMYARGLWRSERARARGFSEEKGTALISTTHTPLGVFWRSTERTCPSLLVDSPLFSFLFFASPFSSLHPSSLLCSSFLGSAMREKHSRALGAYARIPNTVELIPTVGALFPEAGPSRTRSSQHARASDGRSHVKTDFI